MGAPLSGGAPYTTILPKLVNRAFQQLFLTRGQLRVIDVRQDLFVHSLCHRRVTVVLVAIVERNVVTVVSRGHSQVTGHLRAGVLLTR